MYVIFCMYIYVGFLKTEEEEGCKEKTRKKTATGDESKCELHGEKDLRRTAWNAQNVRAGAQSSMHAAAYMATPRRPPPSPRHSESSEMVAPKLFWALAGTTIKILRRTGMPALNDM